MSFKRVIPLAILAMVGASTAAFAARTSTDSGSDRTIHHRRHVVLHRQDQVPAATRSGELPWNLPQGWPQT
jgi:hypothetical protein